MDTVPSRWLCAARMAALCAGVLLGGCRMSHLPAAGPADDTPSADQALPSLVVGPVTGAERDGVLAFSAGLSAASAGPASVSYATADGSAEAGADYREVRGTLTFAPRSTAAQTVWVPVFDDEAAEGPETFELRWHDARGMRLPVDRVTGTITDDDQRALGVEPTSLNVIEGRSGSYRVVLGSRPAGPVTVSIAVPSGAELSVSPAVLEFTPDNWDSAQSVTVTAERDSDALADPPVSVRLKAAGGGYADATAIVRVTVVELDVASLVVAPAAVAEGSGRIGFAVSLSVASAQVVTVDYATREAPAGPEAATGGRDYAATSGTLRFPAGSTAARNIEVTVHDDLLDEIDEVFSVELSNPSHAVLAGAGATLSADGTIIDDDHSQLSIADGTVTEGGGVMRFEVTLAPANARTVTVHYASADVTATAAADYTPASGTLVFAPGSTARTIEVPIADDNLDEQDEEFTVTLSVAVNAAISPPARSATGTIEDDDESSNQDTADPESANLPLELSLLQVTGASGEMYPAFAAGIHHYALACDDATTVRVTAESLNNGARITLLRANPNRNHVFGAGTPYSAVLVDKDDDIVVEVADADRSVRYVVHCIPPDFPTIAVLHRSEEVSEGLLFVVPSRIMPGGFWKSFRAILDNNGVPRFHKRGGARDFRPVDHPVTYQGTPVRYLNTTSLLDANFQNIAAISVVPPATGGDGHDFLVTPDGTFVNIGRQKDPDRDMSGYLDQDGNPYPTSMAISDAIIQETNADRTQLFYWNSWDHRDTLNFDVDCRVANFPDAYATLNSIRIYAGDIIASLRGCAQVLRIDRSGGTGDVVWKLGGTDPGSGSQAEYLELVDDPAGEFCGQHDATLMERGDGRETVVLFDNGVYCLGPRKGSPKFSRVVEYDISSGTQAVMINEFRLPREQGYASTMGGVTVLDNGRWLISWGRRYGASISHEQRITVSEVDPEDGTVHLHIHMSRDGDEVFTYRAYRVPEADVEIPLNLP